MINMNFTINDIKEEAMDDLAFFKGLKLYKDKKVLSSDIEIYKNEYDGYDEYDEDERYIIRSRVDGTSGYYDAKIGIDYDGDIDWYTCTCQAAKRNDYACEHVVAALIHFLHSKRIVKYDNDVFKDPSEFRKLIQVYSDNLRTSSYQNDNAEKITLEPTLELNSRDEFCLSFKIGFSRLYVVKDVYDLFASIQGKETIRYGKNLEINHDIDNFDDKSKKLIDFLISTNSKLYNFNIDREYQGYGYNEKLLKIDLFRVDEFFDFYKNDEINCNISFGKEEFSKKIRFVDDNPKFTFEVKNFDDKCYIFTKTDKKKPLIMCKTAKQVYALDSKNFYRCTDELKKHVIPSIDAIMGARNDILIPKDKYNVFYSTVLVQLSKYAAVNIDDSISGILVEHNLVADVYLDAYKENSIVAEVMFSYGDMKLSYFEINDYSNQAKCSNIARDMQKEIAIVENLEKYSFVKDSKKFVLDGEENIYNFINEGLNTLMANAYVSVTDAFKKITIKRPNPVSMGVKVKNNLIELNIDNLDFDVTELKNILLKYKEKKKYYRLKDGSFLDIDHGYFSTIEKLIQDCSISEKDLISGHMLIPKYRSLYLDKLIKNNDSVNAQRSAEFKSMVNEISDVEEMEFDLPNNLNAKLRKYQENGFKWLKTLSNYTLGGILADDMGLGKTIQIITLLLKEKEETKDKQLSIVICPASLIYNWQAELDKFAPSLKSTIIAGTASQRQILLDDLSYYDIVITSYDSVKRDVEIYKDIKFKYCIIDEAQYIKNSYTQNAVAVKSINSQMRFALTGTPIENSLADLWSIFDFIMPGFLLSYKKFKEKYEMPIVKDNDMNVLDRMNSQIKPFILRRVKKEVLKELPDKIETVSYAKMDNEQKLLYTAELMKFNELLSIEVEEKGFEKSQIKILAMLTRLRQLCCHPSLYVENYKGESAKLELCMQTVQSSVENGHKILIFSQFTSMLDIIADELKKIGLEYYMLTGETKISDRLNLTDKFNKNDVPVFLISLKAGGTGLNLTGADVVIHYDPWWNTSAQNQATDRTHRIGQLNKVNVIKLIVKDSIEEKIEILQQRKQQLIDSVITEKEVMLNTLSKEEIQALFTS